MPQILLDNPIIFSALTAALISALLLRALVPVAFAIGLTDKPSERKTHKGIIPLIGGPAVLIAFTLALSLSDLITEHYWQILTGVLIIGLVGTVDDHSHLRGRTRLIAQLLVTISLLYITDIRVTNVGLFQIEDPIISTLFTIIAIIGLTNAFNLIDGIDGLAGSLMLWTMISIALFARQPNTEAFLLITTLSASLIPFIHANLYGKLNKVFLGDSGSTAIGFFIAWLLIDQSQSTTGVLYPSSVVWCAAIPIFNTLVVMLSRIMAGTSPFYADRTQIHDQFMRRGASSRQTLILILLLAMALTWLGYQIKSSNFASWDTGAFILIFIVMFIWHNADKRNRTLHTMAASQRQRQRQRQRQ